MVNRIGESGDPWKIPESDETCFVAMFLIFATLLSTVGFAQNDVDTEVVYKKVTEVEMGEAEIEGTIVKPHNSLVIERTRALFNPMIKLRRNFTPEISQTVNSVQ